MRILVPLSTLLFVSLAFGEDNERNVQYKDLPPPVQKAAKQQERNGLAIRGYNKEVENGRTFYEVETRVNGMSRDILLDEAGTVVEVEQQIEMGQVPAVAMKGLKKQAGGANILHVESVTKGDKVSYEAVIEDRGKKKEIAVKSDGSRVQE